MYNFDDRLLSILKCANRLLKYEVVSVNVSVFNGLDQILTRNV